MLKACFTTLAAQASVSASQASDCGVAVSVAAATSATRSCVTEGESVCVNNVEGQAANLAAPARPVEAAVVVAATTASAVKTDELAVSDADGGVADAKSVVSADEAPIRLVICATAELMPARILFGGSVFDELKVSGPDREVVEVALMLTPAPALARLVIWAMADERPAVTLLASEVVTLAVICERAELITAETLLALLVLAGAVTVR